MKAHHYCPYCGGAMPIHQPKCDRPADAVPEADLRPWFVSRRPPAPAAPAPDAGGLIAELRSANLNWWHGPIIHRAADLIAAQAAQIAELMKNGEGMVHEISTLLERAERAEAERDEARDAIAWANNSLFGSHGFFLSTRGDLPNNPHHLDTAIEKLKADARLKHQAEAERDKLLAVVKAAERERDAARLAARLRDQDAGRYRWLRDNAGKWECLRDPDKWTDASGNAYWPKVSFCACGTAYHGQTIDAAIDAARKGTLMNE